MNPILAFAVMCLCWGANFAVLKETVSEVPPLMLAGVRFILAGGLMVLWASTRVRSIKLANLPHLIIPSLLTITLNYAPLFWSSQHLPSGILGVINPGSVVLALTVFSLVYGLEKGSLLKLGGIGLGLLGLLLLALPRMGGEYGSIQAIAIGVTVLGSMAYGWGSVLFVLLMRRYTPFELTGWQMLMGGVVLLVLSILSEPPLWSAWLKPPVLAGLLYMVLASSILAFGLNNFLLSVWPASRVATSGFVIPVIALVIGVGLLDERIGKIELLACGLLLLSTMVVQRADQE